MTARAGAHAFTLIELLITIVIIGILMGLIIAVIPDVIYNAKALKTASRMDAILHGLSRVGQQEGSAAMILQRDAHLGGVWQFDTSGGALIPKYAAVGTPGVGTRTDNVFLTAAQLAMPHYFGFPWGKSDLIAQTGPSDTVDSVLRADTNLYYSTVSLDKLDVKQSYFEGARERLCSVQLLNLAGILPPDDPNTPLVDEAELAYLSDRSPERAWNDAWGNPLVIAWGLYQPAGASDDDSGKRVSEALKQYQYNRSVYIAIASVGPMAWDVTSAATINVKPFDLATWRDIILPQLWSETNRVCQPTPGDTWTSDGFDRPPWQGVKKGKIRVGSRTLRCQLTAPHEMK
jgi:prepilin-type N-terminal cleavage/methylation domain-containing protein